MAKTTHSLRDVLALLKGSVSRQVEEKLQRLARAFTSCESRCA